MTAHDVLSLRPLKGDEGAIFDRHQRDAGDEVAPDPIIVGGFARCIDDETQAAVIGRRKHVADPGRDGDVVVGGVHERARGERPPLLEGEPAGAQRGDDLGVRRRLDDDGDGRMVLRRGAHHRGSADVDLLHALVRTRTAGHGLGEGIEVDDDEVERLDAQLAQLVLVLGLAQVGEDARVHLRVQRLHPAVETLGKAGQVLDRGHRYAGLAQPGRRRAGRDHLDPGLGECATELVEPGLVVDADERATDRTLTHRAAPSCR